MTRHTADVPTAVRQMVGRTAARVDGADVPPRREVPHAEAYITSSPDARRNRGLAVALAAVAVIAVAGSVLLGGTAGDEVNQLASRPPEVPSRPTDMYDQAFVDITGPMALPREAPPGLEWVFLTAIDGQQNFVAQSGDILIAVCPASTCSYDGQKVLRTVEVDGATFEVLQYSANKVPPFELSPLPEESRRFWDEVEFVTQRPGWLRQEHTPGGLVDDEESGG